MTPAGCVSGLLVTGLQVWLVCWSVWDHPTFWFILIAHLFLSVINAVISNAEKAPA